MPKRTVEELASNAVEIPGDAGPTVNAATGAWSGVMAIPRGVDPTPVTAVPALPVATSIGVTVPPVSFVTYTVRLSGVAATANAPPVIAIAEPLLRPGSAIGVTELPFAA